MRRTPEKMPSWWATIRSGNVAATSRASRLVSRRSVSASTRLVGVVTVTETSSVVGFTEKNPAAGVTVASIEQELAHQVDPDGANPEEVGVERLEVELVAARRLQLVAGVENHAFAHLV